MLSDDSAPVNRRVVAGRMRQRRQKIEAQRSSGSGAIDATIDMGARHMRWHGRAASPATRPSAQSRRRIMFRLGRTRRPIEVAAKGALRGISANSLRDAVVRALGDSFFDRLRRGVRVIQLARARRRTIRTVNLSHFLDEFLHSLRGAVFRHLAQFVEHLLSNLFQLRECVHGRPLRKWRMKKTMNGGSREACVFHALNLA
jgi:hypothetical protein